jgi:single-strand DNA-binding protein
MINATVRGNVGNVDLKNMPSGDPVLEISIASNDRGKGGTEVTTWVRATVFGKRAESLSRVVKKGDSLLVVGPLSVREFESKGEKRFSVEVKVDQLDFCGGGAGKGVKGPLAALLELAEGVAGPLHFAAFWWREYGFFAADWQESWSSDSAISAFRMTWRDKRDQRIGARREIMRSVFSRWY